MTESIKKTNENLPERIEQLRAILNELCKENCQMNEEKIMLSHYLDQLIAEYMRESNQK